jgi:hypothetical protein
MKYLPLQRSTDIAIIPPKQMHGIDRPLAQLVQQLARNQASVRVNGAGAGLSQVPDRRCRQYESGETDRKPVSDD